MNHIILRLHTPETPPQTQAMCSIRADERTEQVSKAAAKVMELLQVGRNAPAQAAAATALVIQLLEKEKQPHHEKVAAGHLDPRVLLWDRERQAKFSCIADQVGAYLARGSRYTMYNAKYMQAQRVLLWDRNAGAKLAVVANDVEHFLALGVRYAVYDPARHHPAGCASINSKRTRDHGYDEASLHSRSSPCQRLH